MKETADIGYFLAFDSPYLSCCQAHTSKTRKKIEKGTSLKYKKKMNYKQDKYKKKVRKITTTR